MSLLMRVATSPKDTARRTKAKALLNLMKQLEAEHWPPQPHIEPRQKQIASALFIVNLPSGSGRTDQELLDLRESFHYYFAPIARRIFTVTTPSTKIPSLPPTTSALKLRPRFALLPATLQRLVTFRRPDLSLVHLNGDPAIPATKLTIDSRTEARSFGQKWSEQL